MMITSQSIQPVLQKGKHYLRLARLDKPIGTLLLLWPTLWALWLAGNGRPPVAFVMIFILGTICMRSAGCIINDIVDRRFDGFVERTRDRPLISGKVQLYEACVLCCLLLLSALLLVARLGAQTILMAAIGLLLAVIYPFLKRVTHWPQLGLGLAFSWGGPLAFTALTGSVPLKGWVLFLTSMVWPLIYDTLYAAVDQPDDQVIGVKSTAILFGRHLLTIIVLLQIIFLAALMGVGLLFELNVYYYCGLCAVFLLFSYQFILMQRADYFKAFLNNQWVGCFIFMGLLLNYSL